SIVPAGANITPGQHAFTGPDGAFGGNVVMGLDAPASLQMPPALNRCAGLDPPGDLDAVGTMDGASCTQGLSAAYASPGKQVLAAPCNARQQQRNAAGQHQFGAPDTVASQGAFDLNTPPGADLAAGKLCAAGADATACTHIFSGNDGMPRPDATARGDREART